MAFLGGAFGEEFSVKWRKNRTATGGWDVVLFDSQGSGEQEFNAPTLEGALDAAQAHVETLLPPGLRACFSATVIFIED